MYLGYRSSLKYELDKLKKTVNAKSSNSLIFVTDEEYKRMDKNKIPNDVIIFIDDVPQED